MWEESPESKTASRGHQRQVFLFKECIVLCKLKRDTSMNGDIFTFKNKMKVSSVLFCFYFIAVAETTCDSPSRFPVYPAQ